MMAAVAAGFTLASAGFIKSEDSKEEVKVEKEELKEFRPFIKRRSVFFKIPKISDSYFHRIENDTMKVEIDEKELEKYQKWVNKTVEKSREREDYAIVIDKVGRELELYHKGEKVDSCRVAFGPNALDDKLHEGDGCTPEGFYKVNWRRDGNKVKTSFYKALMLNYPTKQDSLEFIAAKKEGRIGEDVDSPGGNIEIHGCGSEYDWTAGCIALDNEDIDRIFPKIKWGTPVTIVKYH